MTALEVLQQRFPNAKPKIAVVLGSGWGDFAKAIQNPQSVSYKDLPGFPLPSVQGHASDLIYGTLGDKEVVILTGRKHTYETGDADGMKLPIRTLKAWGCEVLVQTNAAGSLRPFMQPGSLMMINDHINLSQRSPLIGETGSERFVSMVNAYDADLRSKAMVMAKAQELPVYEGVYAWYVGPQFETPAEIRMAAIVGADAVGMSTVPETIIARHAQMKVLAISLMTNMGAGLSEENISHAHTLSQAQAASENATKLLTQVIQNMTL